MSLSRSAGYDILPSSPGTGLHRETVSNNQHANHRRALSIPLSPTRRIRDLEEEQEAATANRSSDERGDKEPTASGIDEYEDDELDTESLENDAIVNGFIGRLVSTAAISGLLFGYDTGVISGMLVVMNEDLGRELTNFDKELITSITTLGALIGGLPAGWFSDRYGRKTIILLASLIFLFGAVVQAIAHSISTMVIGRFIVGLAIGQASCIVPLYIGELSPKNQRGKMVTINAVAITFGQVIAYAVGAIFQHTNNGWRYMVILGAIPSVIQLTAMRLLPESPRILILQSKFDETRIILSQIYSTSDHSEIEIRLQSMTRAIRTNVECEQGSSTIDTLKSLFKVGGNRRALIVGCGLQATQQLSGFNTLMYYSASIFASLGFKNATGVGCFIAVTNFVFTLVALRIVDPVGRRKTMLSTLPIMVIALFMSALFFRLTVDAYADVPELTQSTGGILIPNFLYSARQSLLIVLSMVIYVAGYATGCGNIPWQQGELFKLEVRGMATGICTATNCRSFVRGQVLNSRLCNLLVASTFLSLMNAITPAGAFALYGLVCFVSWVFCYFCYPETSGLSLEEVFEIFEEDFGVQQSPATRRQQSLNR